MTQRWNALLKGPRSLFEVTFYFHNEHVFRLQHCYVSVEIAGNFTDLVQYFIYSATSSACGEQKNKQRLSTTLSKQALLTVDQLMWCQALFIVKDYLYYKVV